MNKIDLFKAGIHFTILEEPGIYSAKEGILPHYYICSDKTHCKRNCQARLQDENGVIEFFNFDGINQRLITTIDKLIFLICDSQGHYQVLKPGFARAITNNGQDGRV